LFIIDYVVVVVLLGCALGFKFFLNPNHMYVPTVNITTAIVGSDGIPRNIVQTIDIAQDRQFPMVKETLPTMLAGVIFGCVCVLCWVLSQLLLRFLATRKWNVLHDLHNAGLGIAESVALELFFCDALKPFAGRYRPSYLAIAAAASTERDEWEGRVSYPSGHSGTAMATLFFCTLYLLGKTRAYSSKSRFGGGSAGRFGCVVLSLLPTLLGFFVAVTRTRDYKHNFSDINGGIMIGILCSTFAYFNVYPALSDPNCQLPRIRLNPNASQQIPSSSSTEKVNDDASLEEVVVNTDDDVEGQVAMDVKNE